MRNMLLCVIIAELNNIQHHPRWAMLWVAMGVVSAAPRVIRSIEGFLNYGEDKL